MVSAPRPGPHGGAREGTGPKPGAPFKKTRDRSEYVGRLDNVEAELRAFAEREAQGTTGIRTEGGKVPDGLSVMRQRMAFHLWQAGIIQRRLMQPNAEVSAGYKADVAEMERHMAAAHDAARDITPYERSKLATIKHLERDDDFDVPLNELPDDGLTALATQLAAVVPSAAGNDNRTAAQPGDIDDGRSAPAADTNQGRAAATG
jgi:hypothetical protein